MPKTSPVVDNVGQSPSYVHVAFRFIDASGDMRTVSHDIDATDATDAKIEALAVAYGAASNANLYAVEITQVWGAAKTASGATDALKESVYDNVVVQLKGNQNDSSRGFIPAPLASMFVGASDQIDASDAQFTAVKNALVALYTATSKAAIGVRYTERREINEQTAL